jgi:hypothetical protein
MTPDELAYALYEHDMGAGADPVWWASEEAELTRVMYRKQTDAFLFMYAQVTAGA